MYVLYLKKVNDVEEDGGYHESIGENLNSIVTEGCGCKLKIAQMATEDLGGHGSNVVEQVYNHCGACDPEEDVQLN